MTRFISALLRRGDNIEFVLDELKQIEGHEVAWVKSYVTGKTRSFKSIYGLIADRLEHHIFTPSQFTDTSDLQDTIFEAFSGSTVEQVKVVAQPVHLGPKCPKCGSHEYYKREGCESCDSCGYSRCG